MKLTTLWPLFGLLIAVSALPQNARSSATTSRKSKHEKNKFGYTQFGETDPEYWYGQAAADIRERLDILRPLHKRAKNVVFFLGDGMGISTITAARIFKGQIAGQRGEEGYLEMDHFPYSALIKTYNLDKQVPDSAGTATAYLTGVKANFATIGVSAKVNEHTMDCDLINASSVNSILHWALDAGKAAGVVTTTRITHATPAASYAHVPQRDWEGSVPGQVQGLPGCKDIAAQLVEEYPGNRLSVILGGGRREFIPEDQFDPKGALRRGRLVPVKGNRKDGRNLIDKWIKDKSQMPGLDKSEYAFVNNTAGLAGVDFDKVKYLFGLFNHSHMEYDQLRDKGPNGEPSLTQMTEAAIRVLKAQKPDNGFVLLVEGGRIDHAHHDGYANLALYETLELDRAIRRARELLPPEDTLILVTADHSHGLTINGYPARGNPINGWAGEDEDHIPFTTLMYSNGPGHMSHEERENRVIDDTNYVKYRVHAAVHTADTNHAGEDVAVFGTGPMAHFFGGTHEQSYIAHVVGYAACIGVYRNESHCPGAPESLEPHYRPTKPELEREWEEEEEENTIVIKEPGRRQGDATSRSLRLTKAEGRSGGTSRMTTAASDRTLTSLQVFTVILSTSWILFFRD